MLTVYQDLLKDANLYRILRQLDEAMAAEAKELGCSCAGKLHQACYRRKPRGGPPEVEGDEAYRLRLSFCCAEEGCRRRTTPPSVLFLGRKVYFAAVVVLVSVLRQGPTPTRMARLEELVGVSGRTGGDGASGGWRPSWRVGGGGRRGDDCGRLWMRAGCRCRFWRPSRRSKHSSGWCFCCAS
ncbi:MAG: hypothetical protein GY856_36075 [bacterium]|nr:hypothetical protein [bacterium]